MAENEKLLKGLKVARISTVSFFIDTQLKNQLAAIQRHGAEITVVASEKEWENPVCGCTYRSIAITREIHILRDIVSVWRLFRLFSSERFDIVHSTTPKAGLLTAVAGFCAMVPVRMHTFTGQPWVSFTGLKKRLLIWADWIICRLNTICYADSVSQKNFLLAQNVADSRSLKVLGNGSLAGVDIKRFNRLRYTEAQKSFIKKSLNIPDCSFVFIYVGRLVLAKGISELVRAFSEVQRTHTNTYLLLVGPQEQRLDDVAEFIHAENVQNIIFVEKTTEPEKYMAISDVLCIPSYREGFGTVVIEAAAMQLPAIGSNIYGLSDSIEDKKTGLLVPPKSVPPLAEAMHRLRKDSGIRLSMGRHAETRARRSFSSKTINLSLISEYRQHYDQISK